MLETIADWYMAAPYERTLLIIAVANTIVQKTPWKGDDDALKIVKDIALAVFSGGKRRDA